MSTCKLCQNDAGVQCRICKTAYCDTVCMRNDINHNSCKQTQIPPNNLIVSVLKNKQMIGYIAARMSVDELYGKGRGYASVFITRDCPGAYRGTMTIKNTPPAEHILGKNCIEFSYIDNGVISVVNHYIDWRRCDTFLAEFRSAKVNITRARMIAFACDSENYFEVVV